MAIKFGIVGAGNIARKFAQALNVCDDAQFYAISSRSIEKANEFAENYGADIAYGSYDELINDENVDIIYIAILNHEHMNLAKKSILASKAVICEKPLGLDYDEIKEVIDLAREKSVLFMEALWTRFLPPYQMAQKWIEDGMIGEVKMVNANFGSKIDDQDPESRLFNKSVGGGALFDVGCYCVAGCMDMLGDTPISIQSISKMNDMGVDELAIVNMEFSTGKFAQMMFGFSIPSKQDLIIYGTKGLIEIDRFWATKKATRYDDKGNILDVIEDDTDNGFIYEIKEMCRLFAIGAIESEISTHNKSMNCANIIDELKRQLYQEGNKDFENRWRK